MFTFAVQSPLPCGLTFSPKPPRPLRPFRAPRDPRARSRRAPGNRKRPSPGVWPSSISAPPGGATARCIVGTVVRLEPARHTSRDAASPQPPADSAPPRPQPGLGARTPRSGGSALSAPAQRRKLEGRGEELRERGERPSYVLVRFATAAREPRVPAAGGSGGVCGTRRGRRDPAAAAATAKWRRPWRTLGG